MSSTTDQIQNQNANNTYNIKNQLNKSQPTSYVNEATATATKTLSSTSVAVHDSHQFHNTASIEEEEEFNKISLSSPSTAASQTHLQYIYSRPSSSSSPSPSPSMSHHSKVAITTNLHQNTCSPCRIKRHTNAAECSSTSSSSSCCSSASSNSSSAIAASSNLAIGIVESSANDSNLATPVAMTQKTRTVPSDKINLRLILVSGKTKEFLFNPADSAGDIAQIVFDSWPEDWRSEAVSKADILRLIYQGRFLHCNVTLGALGLPLGKTTVMHLVPRDNLPEPNSQDQRQKSKGGSSRCCSTACCIL